MVNQRCRAKKKSDYLLQILFARLLLQIHYELLHFLAFEGGKGGSHSCSVNVPPIPFYVISKLQFSP